MNNLYDILEICLQEIEKGASVETVLSRYPEHAQELRPILEASVQAIHYASIGPSDDVMRRGRSRILKHASQLREAQAQVRPSRRLWSVPLRRALVTLVVLGVLFISSTRLVQASSGTLPGDNLYPVKRTWEDFRILLTFNSQAREELEIEHENERLEEVYELIAERRSVEVDFSGTVANQNGDLWLVANIPVLISSQTDLSENQVAVGNAVRVRGYTQSDGTVLAERVLLLPDGIPLPSLDDDQAPSLEQEEDQQDQEGSEDSSDHETEEAPRYEATKSPEEDSHDGDATQVSDSENKESSHDGGNEDGSNDESGGESQDGGEDSGDGSDSSSSGGDNES